MAAIEKKGKKETGLNDSRSLLEGTMSQEADSDNFRSQESESVIMVTARDTETVEDTVNQTADNPDSLALNISNGENPLMNENRGLQEELALRTQSLQDTQAKVEELKSKAATALRLKEHLEAEIASKDSEIAKLAGVVKALKQSLDMQPADAKDNTIKKQRNKIVALEKSLAEARAEAKTATEVAEKQRSVTAGFEVTQRAHLAEIKMLKRQTLCLDPDCTSDKVCGRSHSKKEENLGQCNYFNFGRCNRENCKYKHDAAVKLKFHEDRKKVKEAKEKEEKEKKEGEKDKTEDDKKKKESEAKGKEKSEKAKQKKKRKKGQKKAEVVDSDSSMSVDDPDPDSSSNTAAPAKKAKKSKGEKPKGEKPKVTSTDDNKAGSAPAPTQPPKSNLYTYPPPPIPNQPPQTSYVPRFPNFQPPFQPTIPQNFDFGQQNLQAAAASSAPFTGQYGAVAARGKPLALAGSSPGSSHDSEDEAEQVEGRDRCGPGENHGHPHCWHRGTSLACDARVSPQAEDV